MRNTSLKCNANMYQSYQSAIQYRDVHCTPKPIVDCMINDNDFICPMEDLNNHQLKKIFWLKPSLKNDMAEIQEAHPDAKFFEEIKYGGDSASKFKIFDFQPKKPSVNQVMDHSSEIRELCST